MVDEVWMSGETREREESDTSRLVAWIEKVKRGRRD